MSHAVFTYGTLLSSRVLHALLGRVPSRADGTLYGYQRFPIRDACYPAVVRSVGGKNDVVQGKLLLNVTARELALLDAFEDPAYDRALVAVQRTNGDCVQARLWARPDSNRGDLVLDKDWGFEQFLTEDEDWMVARCFEWVATHRENNVEQIPLPNRP